MASVLRDMLHAFVFIEILSIAILSLCKGHLIWSLAWNNCSVRPVPVYFAVLDDQD